MASQAETRDGDFALQRARFEQTMDALQAYGWSPVSLIPVGSGYKVESPRGPRFLKRFRFGPQEMALVFDVLEHLRSRGFQDVPRIYLTRGGDPYIHVDGELLYLQDWYDLSRPDMNDPGTLRLAAEVMARMHLAGERFGPRPELRGLREDYGSWLDKCVERLRDLYGFAELAEVGRRESKFDTRYAKAAPVFCRHGEEAVRRLAGSSLESLARRERELGAICHRNFTPRNLALDGRMRLQLLDFDSSGLEIRLEDLAKFIRRTAGLDLDRAAFILQSYGEARGNPLSREELGLIGAYLLFPMEFWAVGRSCYQKDRPRSRTLRRLIDNAESWARFAAIVGSLEIPAEPVLVAVASPEAVLTPEGPDTPDVPDGPHLPVAPSEPDATDGLDATDAIHAMHAEPLALQRLDVPKLVLSDIQEVFVPMWPDATPPQTGRADQPDELPETQSPEPAPIYQSWPAPQPEETDDDTQVAAPASEPVPELVFAQSAPDEDEETQPVVVLETGTQIIVPHTDEGASRRLVWGPLPIPVRPASDELTSEVLEVQTAAAPDEDVPEYAGVESPPQYEETEQAEEPAEIAETPADVAEVDVAEAVADATLEAVEIPEPAYEPVPDESPVSEDEPGPAEIDDAKPKEDLPAPAATPGPRTIVWAKWPEPVQRPEDQ